MSWNRIFALGAAPAIALCCLPEASAGEPRPVSAVDLGFDEPKAIGDGFTTEPIDMLGQTLERLSLNMTITWGTSTEMEIQLLEGDLQNGTYKTHQRCTSAEVHVCKPRRWLFGSGDGTTPALDFPRTHHRWLKVVIVAGSGTGTVKATATRAP